MPDNVLQTLQQLVQDVIAPDVRELKVRLSALEQKMDIRFTAVEQRIDIRFTSIEQRMDIRFTAIEQRMDSRFTAMDQKNDAQFRAILAAIAESKAQAELSILRAVTPLSERVAALEARGH